MTRRRLELRVRVGIAAALLAASAARADEVVRRHGKTLEGTVRKADAVVLVNPYGSTLDEMTYGVVEVPAAEVAEVRPDRGPSALARAFLELDPNDVAARKDLLAPAVRRHARPEARRLAAEILRVAPDDPDALAVVGGREAFLALRGEIPSLDPALERALHRLVRMESAVERADAARALGVADRRAFLERAARSLTEAVGRRDAERAPEKGRAGGVGYVLDVPAAYDPLHPVPLVVALHGGAPATGPVTGTAQDAWELFHGGAAARGWLLAAVQAPPDGWRDARGLVAAVIEDVRLRFDVDLDRVYLVGEGDGADAALDAARTLGRSLAGVAAAGPGDPRPVGALVTSGLGVWLYEGAADERAGLVRAREVADRLVRREGDFVYAELSSAGRGLPAAAERDAYHFLAGQRRRSNAASAWPDASFGRPVDDPEVQRLGDPRAAWGDMLAPDLDTGGLVAVLAAGGPDAEAAARRLLDDPSAGPRVRGVLTDRDAPATARRWAAFWLGRRGNEDDVGPLADLVRAAADAPLRREAARALARLGAAGARSDLLEALDEAARALGRPGDDPALRAWRFGDASRTLVALVDALGRAGGGTDVAAAIERDVVVPILKEPGVGTVPGADPSDVLSARADLARAVARAYARLGAEATLMDLLVATLSAEPEALAAARAGYAEGAKPR